MDIKPEFVSDLLDERGDTYRFTFEGEIQSKFQWLLLKDTFVQIESNIFEAPVSRVISKFGSELNFHDSCIWLAKTFQQQNYKLDLVSSISKADRDRLANTWLSYGFFALTQQNSLIPSSLVPYFLLEDHCSPQQIESDNQARVQRYSKEKNVSYFHCQFSFSFSPVQEILQSFSNIAQNLPLG